MSDEGSKKHHVTWSAADAHQLAGGEALIFHLLIG
jgi:hypothetical protein